ncbi:MAG: 3-dehydroquinate synthase [Eggerthellaceae bacterium]|nr:3-dehydroquinate synthase [Eggerthellaceae bacterium]
MATKVIVEIPGQPEYAVRIGSGVLDSLGQSMRGVPSLASLQRALVITDSNVGPLYLARCKASLSGAGFKVSDIAVPAGESSKSLEVAGEIWRAMAQLDLGRDCVVIALGGGVVGDLAGFVASTFMRGVPIVQVPTTLLAMVDSSVGGKTAANLPEGKNLVGTFYQPSVVCADTSTLETLPHREWVCGCGEVAKSAIIDSDEFFFWLSDHADSMVARDPETVSEAIARCVVFKADVVAQDVTESSGVRECLNYGHTLGHAIESCAGFGRFSHGECVAEGMRFATLLAAKMAGSEEASLMDFAEAQVDLLDALELKSLDLDMAPEQLMEAMRHDKKARGGDLRFVLVEDVGDWKVARIPDDVVLAALDTWLEWGKE